MFAPIFLVPSKLTRLWCGPMKVVEWIGRPISARIRVSVIAIVKCAKKNRVAIQMSIPPLAAKRIRNIPPKKIPEKAVRYRMGSLLSVALTYPIACRIADRI